MIHYVYMGDFVHEGNFIKFQKQADGALRPVVSRPISTELVEDIFKQNGVTISSIPDEWGLWFDEGFVVCDRFTRSRTAIEIIRRLATETGCDVADYWSQTLISPEQLTFVWEPQIPSVNGSIQDHRNDAISTASAQSD